MVKTIRRERRAFPGLLAWVVLCATLAWAAPRALGEGRIVTPTGESVVVEHTMLPGGVVEEYDEYIDSAGKRIKHGPYKRYYRNGAQQEWTTYDHGIEHGPFVVWQGHNTKELEGQNSHGRLNGRITRYFPTGRPQRVYHYEQGRLEGPFVTYFEDGSVRSIGDHREGKKSGPYTEYHAGGAPYLRGTYTAGYLNGEIALYSESGEPAAKGMLIQERVSGPWLCLDKDGKIARRRPECANQIFWDCPCP